MIEAASCLLVSRNVDTPGGTVPAIAAMVSSGITPGPLGMANTSPIADAPESTAICASLMLPMQQILTRGMADGRTDFLTVQGLSQKTHF